MAADKKVIAELELQTGRSKQNLQEVTNEITKQEEVGARYGSNVTRQLENVENATVKLLKKEQEGTVITERDANAVILNYERLKNAVDSYVDAGGKIGPELEKSLGTARKQYDLATTKVREARDAVQDSNQVLKEGGGQWLGLGESVNRSIGSFGKFQVGILAAGAALKEGIQIGTAFAQAIGTNFSAAESAAANLKASLAGVTNALTTDGFGAAVDQARASLRFLGDSITGGGKAIEGFNAMVQSGVDRTKALTASEDQLKQIADAHALAVKGGADAQKLFNDMVTSFDPKYAAQRLGELTERFKDLALQEKEAKEKHDELVKSQEASIGTLNNLIQALKNEAQAHKDGVDEVQHQIDKYKILRDEIKKNSDIQAEQEENLGGATLSMHGLLEEIEKLIPEYDRNEARVKNAAAALRQLLEVNETLTLEQKKYLEQIEEQIENYDKLSPAQKAVLQGMIQEIVQRTDAAAAAKAHSEGMDDLHQKTDQAATSQEKINVVTRDGKTVIENNTEKVKESKVAWDEQTKTLTNVEGTHKSAKGTVSELGGTLDSQKQVIINYNAQLQAVDQHLIDIATHARDATKAIREFGDATHNAAGDPSSSAGNNMYPGVTEEAPTPGSSGNTPTSNPGGPQYGPTTNPNTVGKW